MKPSMARRFLERIYRTKDEELDCGAMMQLIDRYVELDVSSEDAAEMGPDVPHHLSMCRDCAELAAALGEMVRLEESGELPEVDQLWSELAAMTGPARVHEEPSAGASGQAPSDSLLRRLTKLLRR